MVNIMKINNHCLRYLIAGLAGGITSWLLVEPFTVDDIYSFNGMSLPVFGAIVGFFIGFALGGGPYFFDGLNRQAIAKGAIAGSVGLVGGAIALVIADLLFNLINPAAIVRNITDFFVLWLSRTVGWSLFGLIIGIANGATRGSKRGIVSSALGGLIGGGLGGASFDTISPTLAGFFIIFGFEIGGEVSRLIALASIGGFTGLFIGIMELVFTTASIKIISSGRLEGRKFILEKPLISLGRNERCDIALYYDKDIKDIHAKIELHQNTYTLSTEKDAHIEINEISVVRHFLTDGDVLKLGGTRLIFRTNRTTKQAFPKRWPFLKFDRLQKVLCSTCLSENRKTANYCFHCGKLLT